MVTYETQTFKCGSCVALRLPSEFGIAGGVPMTIERHGDTFIVRRLKDPAEEKRKLRHLLAALRALPAPSELGARDSIEFPERFTP